MYRYALKTIKFEDINKSVKKDDFLIHFTVLLKQLQHHKNPLHLFYETIIYTYDFTWGHLRMPEVKLEYTDTDSSNSSSSSSILSVGAVKDSADSKKTWDLSWERERDLSVSQNIHVSPQTPNGDCEEKTEWYDISLD